LEILKIHTSGVALDGEIDFESVVKMSDQLNGADLRNVVTEAYVFESHGPKGTLINGRGLFAIKDYRDSINQDDFNKAVRKVAESKKLEGKLEYQKLGFETDESAVGMSYALPRNLNAHRHREDGSWGHAAQNGHTGTGIGAKLDGYFDKRELPMYKDKPYSYAVSRRNKPLYQRWRFTLGVILFLFALLYWFGFFSSSKTTVRGQGRSAWKWLNKPGTAQIDWDDRREKVREAFKLSWDGYEKYAWGYDKYYPLSKHGGQMTDKGMGWIIVDALDTLMIMNLTTRLTHAREWISTSLNYDQDQEVNTFETTIRMLGGLLSAEYLSTAFPDLAPLADDDEGAPGEDLYREKAADLADRILGAFDSESGVPYASVNLKTSKGVPSHADGGASSTAEASSLQLEFKYLSMLTGEKNYWERAEKVIQVIDDNAMTDGLLPIFIYASDGRFRGDNIRLGSRGDSYYEYLIKQYLQTSEEEPIYLEMWNQALAGVRKHLITYTKNSHFTVLAERPNGLGGELYPKMDHLVCFMPGTIALAATGGLTVKAAKKAGKWGPKQQSEIDLAKELTKTCWGMYKATGTGLAGEITFFEINDPPRSEADGIPPPADFTDASWKDDFVIKRQDSHNLQRPETVETLFYMWRITEDVTYREWGWEMFKSFVNFTQVEGDAGYTSVANVLESPPPLRDNMESFWLAETLKYFYLLFSPTDLLPLDTIVINTEAHIFPRSKLVRGLKTGWTRKPRDAEGKLVEHQKSHSKKEKGGGESKVRRGDKKGGEDVEKEKGKGKADERD
ncbi:MAG: hypothetical protein Q9214_005347, partial [Letrouitia sp. 1 TL-2023]